MKSITLIDEISVFQMECEHYPGTFASDYLNVLHEARESNLVFVTKHH